MTCFTLDVGGVEVSDLTQSELFLYSLFLNFTLLREPLVCRHAM